MKLFLSVLTCLVLARVSAGEQCTTFAKSCNDNPFMAKIVCPDGKDCECEDSTGTCPEDLSDLHQKVDSEQCRSLCDPAQCKYFRWEKDSLGSNCTFMQADQCKDYKQCEGDTHCVSDQVPECEDDPAPTTGNCTAGSEFNTTHGAVHWTCYDPYHPGDYVSIYHPGKVPAGTICWTVHRCINFDTGDADPSGDIGYRNLVAQCSEGQWVTFNGGNDITAPNAITEEGPNGKLIDQTCLPKDEDNLVLDANKLMEVGVSFICTLVDEAHYDTNTPNKIILKQYNHCVLLCNFHLVMTIEPKLAGDGGDEPTWWKYPANGEEGEKAKEENVKCWD